MFHQTVVCAAEYCHGDILSGLLAHVAHFVGWLV
jgi:hypothetical protein